MSEMSTASFLALARRAAMEGGIDLTTAVPHFDVAQRIERIASELLLSSRGRPYLDTIDTADARARLTELYAPRNAGERGTIFTHGATGALASALIGLTSPGDLVGVVRPYYTGYTNLIKSLNRRAFIMSSTTDNYSDGVDLRAVIVNSPRNPDGAVISASALQELAQRFSTSLLVLDEVYSSFSMGDPVFRNFATAGWDDRLIRIHSASKLFGLAGWRVGWLNAHANHLAAISEAHTRIAGGPSHPFVVAVSIALSELLAPAQREARKLQEYVWRVCDELERMGAELIRPHAGPFIGIRAHAAPTPAAFATRLAQDADVYALPWSAFGESFSTPTVRLSISRTDLVPLPTIKRIADAAQNWRTSWK